MMTERSLGLATDLYQLTMAAAYFDNGVYDERAIFELFVRKLPKQRSYLLAAGLEQALEYLQRLRFTVDDVDYIREHPAFAHVSREFFAYLSEFRFTGDVWAMPEGTPFFAAEPTLRVEAPIIEAQIVETFLLATMNFQTMIASKAARLVTAAKGRDVIEFGTRRAHGTEAGLLAARAAYLAGCAGTSNVEAGYRFGIPAMGTMAHSFVMAFDNEREAFTAFLKVFPESATVLVDTYDTIEAVKMLATKFRGSVPAIRLDSGDLLNLSIEARNILDAAGMTGTKIFASNDLNEYLISDLIAKGAKIDAFGVGTQLATSFDYPALSGVYKLVGSTADGVVRMRMKHSPDKATLPGAKQVWRRIDNGGKYVEDVIALATEPPQQAGNWHSLLEPVMRNGKPLGASLSEDDLLNEGNQAARRAARLAKLNEARARAKRELGCLPDELLALEKMMEYPVSVSERLEAERERLQSLVT